MLRNMDSGSLERNNLCNCTCSVNRQKMRVYGYVETNFENHIPNDEHAVSVFEKVLVILDWLNLVLGEGLSSSIP